MRRAEQKRPSGGSLSGQMKLGIGALMLAGPLSAQTVRCDLDGVDLAFDIATVNFR